MMVEATQEDYNVFCSSDSAGTNDKNLLRVSMLGHARMGYAAGLLRCCYV
jgi:hypothetical protein